MFQITLVEPRSRSTGMRHILHSLNFKSWNYLHPNKMWFAANLRWKSRASLQEPATISNKALLSPNNFGLFKQSTFAITPFLLNKVLNLQH